VIATFSPTKLSNIHSFSVTENYAIFFFYPVIIDPKARGWRGNRCFRKPEKSTAKFQKLWVK
jgi:carotenoid cleavage dioxygenase-like enzyme